MERLSAVFDAASVGISVLDTRGRIVRINPRLCEQFGLSEKELIGMSSRELTYSPEEDLSWPYYEQTVIKKSHEPIRLEKKYKRYNNKIDYWWADLWISPIYYEDKDEVEYFVSILIDITEKKEIREQLIKSQAHYQSLFDNLNTAAAVYKAVDDGEDFVFVDFNKAGEKIEDLPKERLIGRSVLEIFPRVKEFGLFDIFKRVYKTGQPEFMPATEYKDGRIRGRWRENLVYKQPTGEIVALYLDVTERMTAEKDLKESEQKFSLAFNTSPYALVIAKPYDGVIVEVNEAFCNITGYTREEALNSTISGLNIWPDIQKRSDLIKSIIKGEIVRNVELNFRIKNGNMVTGLFSATLITLKNESYILSSTYDITEQRKIETALESSRVALSNIEAAKQQDLLESARALNAGVAHELRTPMQAFLNIIEYIEDQMEEASPSCQNSFYVQKIKDSIEDAKAQLTYTEVVLNSLSAFAKAGAAGEGHLINVVTELKTIMRTLRYTDKFKVLKEEEFILSGEEQAFININQIEFVQIITNLCKNSIEAMQEQKDPLLQLVVSIVSGNVQISIIDNGDGIPEGVGNKIFEPYFSTKEVKEVYNQGLGLSIVKNIVFAYNGRISYKSVPGYTEFIVTFPCAKKMEKEN